VGSTYGNVTLLGVTPDQVQAVAPRPAHLAADGDAVVVFAAVDDEGAARSGRALSESLGCLAVGVAVYDDDILSVDVHDHGRLVGSLTVPDPQEYFDLDPEMLEGLDQLDEEAAAMLGGAPMGAADLVRAVGRGDIDAVTRALAEGDRSATQRHRRLVDALGLPTAAVGWGHRYLTKDPDAYTGPALTTLAP
jgi:hypothetical protein